MITPQYESVSPISPQAVKVEKEGKYTLFDYYGKQLASSFYDDIVLRKLGYFRFKKNGKVGLLNPLGKEIIPAIYTKIDLMKDGYVKIFDGLRQGVATIDNRILLPAKYYRIKPVRFNRSFAASSAFIKPADWVNGEYQLVRRFDNYLQVYPMDVNCFKVRNGEYWGLIDSLGNDILLPKYESLQIASAQ